jgi:hypothetical protein
MDFTQAVSEVVDIIKRPDLINKARREVNSAISFYTLDNEFKRDYKEQAITLDGQEYTQQFLLSVMTRFRKFHYLKRGGTKKYLSLFSDAEMKAGCTDRDKYYIAGTAVNISLAALAATLDVGYFMYPPVLTDSSLNRDHWLLEVAPYLIIDRAAAVTFRNIGDEKSMQAYAASAKEAYLAMRKDQGWSTQ